MKLTDTVDASIDDGCPSDLLKQDFQINYPQPPANLVEKDSYGRLVIWLRAAADSRDASTILTRSAAAFHLIHTGVALTIDSATRIFGPGDPLLGFIPPLDDGFATALADLSVTGRSAFASFCALNPVKTTLVSPVAKTLTDAGIPANELQVAPDVEMALDRAYLVARALRGSVSERLVTRPALIPSWIAVSAESDPPHRPVNIASAPFPQFSIAVPIPGGPTVQTRFFVGSPDPIAPAAPAPPGRAIPTGDQLAIPSGPHDRVMLFIHGHGSNAEECLRILPALQAEGNAVGIRLTVIAFDLPNNGCSSMFDHHLVAPSAATTYPGGILDHGPVTAPILDFVENGIIAFVNSLDVLAPFTSRCIGVFGGSLGGNMGLRLGRNPAALPWLKNGIVAWSPAGVWDPLIQDEVKRCGPDHCRDKWDEAEKFSLPGSSDSRKNYFIETFAGGELNSNGYSVVDAAAVLRVIGVAAGIGFGLLLPPGVLTSAVIGLLGLPPVIGSTIPVQANTWYRDGWTPCKGLVIAEDIGGRYDVYNTFYRQWNWRIAGEQLIYSHVDRVNHEDPNTPWRYQLNTVRTLLASGARDDYQAVNIFTATRTLSSRMTQCPGRSLFINETGHSIHIERPGYFAREMVSFLTLEAGATSSGAVVSRGQSQLDLFAIGRDGQMLHRSGDGSIWQPPLAWEPLGGNFASPPAATASGPNPLDVFGIGLDGQMLHRSSDGTNWSASGWQPIGMVSTTGGQFTLTGVPAVAARSKSVVDIFVLGIDTRSSGAPPAMLHMAWDTTSGLLTPWENLGGAFTSSPAVVSWGSGRIDVFALGANHQMLHKAMSSGSWVQSAGVWESLGGVFSSMPAAVAWAPNRLDVFAVGLQGQMLHKVWNGVAWQPPNDPLGLVPWEDLGGMFTSAPVAVSWSSGRLDIFALGLGRLMYHKAWDGSAWLPTVSDWKDISSITIQPQNITVAQTFTCPPIAASWGANRLDVFDIGYDGQMFHRAMNDAGWLS